MLFGNNRFSMTVLVDGLPVTEYTESESNTWVESTFEAKSTFREEISETCHGDTYMQTWPFTPFVVKVMLLDRAPGKCYLAEMFVDGVRAQHKILEHPGRVGVNFVGFAEKMGFDGGEKAFCFSMPRPVSEGNGQSDAAEKPSKEKVIEIGSVRVDIHETTMTNANLWQEVLPTGGSSSGGAGSGSSHGHHGSGSSNSGFQFKPTDKKTAKAAGSVCAVRAGHTLPGSRAEVAKPQLTPGGGDGGGGGFGGFGGGGGGIVKPRMEMVQSYTPPTESNKIASCRIRYATRDKLDDLGLVEMASMGLLNTAGPGASSKAAPSPPPDSGKYSAAHIEACLKHFLGDALQITPDVRSALRDCEDMFMPVLPFLCLPKTGLPPIFTEWSQGKSSLDNQDVSKEGGYGKKEVESKSTLVAKTVGGNQESSLSRAMSHQIFGSEQLYTVVEKLIAHGSAGAAGGEASCDSAELSAMAHVMCSNIMVWSPSDEDPILVKPRTSKFGSKCYNVGLATGAFNPKRGRFWSMVDKEDAAKEEEMKTARKKRRKGGA